MDIWRRARPKSKDWELMIVGRLFILFLVGVSIIWIPIIQANQGSRLFDYIQAITSYLAPPVCAIYILAIFTTRTNEQVFMILPLIAYLRYFPFPYHWQ